jgi:hypothetical protein
VLRLLNSSSEIKGWHLSIKAEPLARSGLSSQPDRLQFIQQANDAVRCDPTNLVEYARAMLPGRYNP